MKFYFCKNFSKLTILVISFISLNSSFLDAEYLFEELPLDTTTKAEEDNSIIPTNPFEIAEMIRRFNSLNDATSPSDALDDALESFNSLGEKEEI